MPLALAPPSVKPPLDETFRPAVLANRAFRAVVAAVGTRLVLGLERSESEFSRFETLVFPEGHSDFESNFQYIERILKFLLWQRGGYRLYVGGPRGVADHLSKLYSAEGAQKFDFHFLGEQVYERPFTVTSCHADEAPASREAGKLLGRHLAGHRPARRTCASPRTRMTSRLWPRSRSWNASGKRTSGSRAWS